MPFIIADDFFIRTMYFMEHTGQGFKLSSDETDAKQYNTFVEADKAREALETITGWKCKVNEIA